MRLSSLGAAFYANPPTSIVFMPSMSRSANSHMVNSLDFEAHFPALDRLGWVDSRMPLEELSSLEGGVHTIKVFWV